MERVLYSVVPDGAHWAVHVLGSALSWYPSKLAALLAADAMAQMGNSHTGTPTGVEVRMLCGDAVLAGCYG